MISCRTQKNSFRHQQKGAVLAISLMILVVLTVLGVAGVNGSILDFMMAGNTQFQTRALANAENALIEAEEYTYVNLDPSDTYIEKGVTNIATSGRKNPYADKWGTDDAWTTGTNAEKSEYDPADSNYIIEYVGAFPVLGNSVKVGSPSTGTWISTYMITAHSKGAKGAERMVQSVFVK